MSLHRQEIPNNTPEQVNGYIAAALGLVATLEPPEDLRSAVFTAAVNLFSSKQVVMTQPQAVDLAHLGLGGIRQ